MQLNDKNYGIQATRALAALLVVIGHILAEGSKNTDSQLSFNAFANLFPWAAGVDIFFVISGFIMMVISAGHFSDKHQVWPFLHRRLIRIVPVYWFFTALTLVLLLLLPNVFDSTKFEWGHTLSSFFFYPGYRNAAGFIQPILGLGWTLNYEMLFYLLFAGSLILPKRVAIVALGAILIALAALHPFTKAGPLALSFWTNPIMLEFVLGLLAGWFYLKSARLARLPAFLLMFIAMMLMWVSGKVFGAGLGGDLRFVFFGVPALLFVLGAAFADWNFLRASLVGKLLERIGNASYTLYLSHPFVLSTVFLFWQQFSMFGGVGRYGYVAISALLCIVFALLFFQLAERPMTQFLRGNKPR